MNKDHSAMQFYERKMLDKDLATDGESHSGTLSIVQCAAAALNAFRSLATKSQWSNSVANGNGGDLLKRRELSELNALHLLVTRSKILGLSNPGVVSANRYCHLIETQSGWIALNLAREEDWTLIPAWLEVKAVVNDWPSIETLVATRCGKELVARGRLMGLPVAMFDTIRSAHWYSIWKKGLPAGPRKSVPLVIDLSSLWAGPLCSHLLQCAGATVLKVESRSRPDSTSQSAPAFHREINGGKQSVILDFDNPKDIVRLKALIKKADFVIEGSRPRALRQLGINAEQCVEQVPGLIWLSITGYGRHSPQDNWVAFGDDAAIAGGLAELRGSTPNFVGDAVGDPLTGIHAAVAGLLAWHSGVGSVIDISLAGVASYVRQQLNEVHAIDLNPDLIVDRSQPLRETHGVN